MPLGFSSISEYAISEIPGGVLPGGGGGAIEIEFSLLWDLDIQDELLFELGVDYTLLFDLDIAAHIGEDLMVTPIDIGDTVTLSAPATFDGDVIPTADYTLQIKTPDRVQWPDISGSSFTYDPSTQRYSYRYFIEGDYAQVGTHYFRFRVRTTDSEGNVRAAKWKPIIVRNMPFAET
jgi:hypothetical protein